MCNRKGLLNIKVFFLEKRLELSIITFISKWLLNNLYCNTLQYQSSYTIHRNWIQKMKWKIQYLIRKLKLQCFGHLIQSQLIGKDSDAGKDWGQEEKWVTEDEMVGWHHWLNGYEFEQTPGDSGGQGSLACCRSTGSLRVRHTLVTERQQSVTEVGLIHRPSISQAGSHPSIPQRSATQQMPKEFKRARTPCSVND